MALALQMEGVARRYRLGADNFVDALRGVDLSVEAGDMVAIMGPSGSGKSTLMHIAGGLDTPDSGAVWLEGTRIDTLSDRRLTALRSRRIGFVFQGFNLLPALTALENTALAGQYGGMSRRQASRRAAELLEVLGLGGRARHRPSELSGGEQQRVAIARALMNDPCLLMADEPTGNLDSATSAEIMTELERLNRERGMTLMLVTHDPGVAGLCRRRVEMHDGSIVGTEAEAAP
ncbi:MAG: ABC transporter ATP-binding protein [Thermoleophilia bacterium]|jgi:putative ABC transport system ATP-binding protein|nr:ABC transporter ATP-binding protein [Thermoleophilia bacterium]